VLISIPVLLRAWQGCFTIICVGNPRDQPPRSGKRNGLKNVLNFFQHPLLYQSVYLFMGSILRWDVGHLNSIRLQIESLLDHCRL